MASAFTGVLKIIVVEADGLKVPERDGHRIKQLDPYCAINIDEQAIGRTTNKAKSTSPVWNEEFEGSAHRGRYLEIGVFHREMVSERFVASVSVPLSEFITESEGSANLWVRCLCVCLSLCLINWLL